MMKKGFMSLVVLAVMALGAPAFADDDNDCLKDVGHVLSDCIKGDANQCDQAIDQLVDDRCIDPPVSDNAGSDSGGGSNSSGGSSDDAGGGSEGGGTDGGGSDGGN